MEHNHIKTALVVPCYNEEHRLDVDEYLKHCSKNLRIVFVDDGSSDSTLDVLNSMDNKYCDILSLESNQGKAEAVRQGMLFCQNKSWFESLDWIGYWDADLSTPLGEIDDFYIYFNELYGNVDAIFGSRIKRNGSEITRRAMRHYLGRIFATIANPLFKLTCYDTQCGAKLFSRDTSSVIFNDRFESRWCFDIELILRMKDREIIEYPLKRWVDIKGSKINVVKSAFPVLWELMKIYRRYK